MTVYEQIKGMSIEKMAALIGDLVDHEKGFPCCRCPIGETSEDTQNKGHCGFPVKGCDEAALAWLKSEDVLRVVVPGYLK